ncbi:MAG: metallophosphoesterase [Alistipes sp.]|nr:metallophosphoesterase [Alistipes sp.]
MNINKCLFWVLSLAIMTVSCVADQTIDEPINGLINDSTTISDGEYVRLNLSTDNDDVAPTSSDTTRAVWDDAKGSGNLPFKWESVDIDSEMTSKLSLILSDGTNPVLGTNSSQTGEVSYSGLSVTPHEKYAHRAKFQTVNYYAPNDLANATYCYAIAGGATITEDRSNGEHICHLDMPATFTQSASQEPSFLRDYMYMYATTAYKGDNTLLKFKHIPATFRFIITNSKSKSVSLQEVSVSVSDGSAVASKALDLKFDWSDGIAKLFFGDSGHDKVSVVIGNNVSLAQGEQYTAYAMALPHQSDDVFRGKTLNFTLKSDNSEQLAFQLDGAKLATLNRYDRSNWVGGKVYTIRINIVGDGKATGTILDGNRIEVTPGTSGLYTLVYEDASCLPLADYADICTLTIDELAYYEDFIDVNIAPREANTIGIYDSAGERKGSILLSDFRPDFTQKPLYSFGLLSDVHIGRAVINPESDFSNALSFFNAKGVAHTCICGDITQNGKEAEYSSYKSILPVSKAPVYTVTGNHDATTSGINLDLWSQYIDQPIVYERSVTTNGNVDHFLFLGMSIWNFNAPYLEEHLAWLEEKLEEYRNDRCFIITHLFFPDRAGNLNGIYPSGNWLRGEQLERLQRLCDKYVNSIWFSGHSHWEWQLQKYQDRANIYRGYAGTQPTSGWCVHVPSCGVPITSDGTTRVDNTPGSEGAVVEVYENHIDILGIDFASNKYLPIATYRLNTAIQEIAARKTHYITAKDFVVNQSKAGATVKDVEGMPNYVEVTFTAKGQGFYVANDTYTSNTSKVNIIVENVQATSNDVIIDVPANVGFYGSSGYYLSSTSLAEVSHGEYTGVQFQTSNSKYGDGPLPLTLRMKFQMEFY